MANTPAVTETVELVTVAQLASFLGVTGQAISAWHKSDTVATPVPAFMLRTSYGKRQVELLWTQEQVADWQVAVTNLAAAQQEKIIEAAAKAQERAAKALAAVEKAQAALAKAQGQTVDPDQLTLEV